MYTLDTNTIIYFLKDDPKAVSFFDDILQSTAPLFISAVSELELFAFSHLTPSEEERIIALLQTLIVIPVDSRVARIAGFLRRQYRLETPDAAIAATALTTGTALATRNVRDFRRVPDLQLHTI